MPQILTIAIPTFNRSWYLRQMLDQLYLDLGDFLDQVQILVSDNASTDQTPEILRYWTDKIGNEKLFKSIRQSENIGASRNVVSLFFEANTPWLIFLGDDDRINPAFLPELFSVLHSQKNPSACIMTNWGNDVRGEKVGYGTYENALTLFYEYGNAWAGVIRRDWAVDSILKRNLRSKVESTIWPQTILGYLAMYDARSSPVYFSKLPHGDLLLEWPSITNKAYWVRSFHDLLKAAVVVCEETDDNLLKKKLVNWKTPGFIGHLRAIIRFSLIEKNASDSCICQQILRKEFGFNGVLWATVLWLSDQKRGFLWMAMMVWCIREMQMPDQFKKKINQFRNSWLDERKEAESRHKRSSDLF